MRSEYQIHKRVAFLYLLDNGRFLHHAAAQGNFFMRIFLFHAVHKTKPSIHALVCIVTHGAGVVKHQIRRLVVNHFKADFFENANQLFAVLCIHLTAERFAVCRKTSAKLSAFLRHDFARFFHKIVLTHRFFGGRG